MRKSWMAILLAACSVVAIAGAPPVRPNPEVAEKALQAYLKTASPALIAELESRTRQDLEAGALREPKEVRVANILLKRGLTGAGIRYLLEPRGMEIVGLEARCPTSRPEDEVAIGIGQRSLVFASGNLEERVDMAVGRERHQLMQRAEQLARLPGQAALAEQTRSIALSHELAVYRIEAYGTREALFTLQKDPLVRAVFVDDDPRRVAAVQGMRRDLEATIIMRGPTVSMGRVDPNAPLPMPPMPDGTQIMPPQVAVPDPSER